MRELVVTNGTSARVELFLLHPTGPATTLGNLAAGASTNFRVRVGRVTPTVSAYIGSGMTRTQVACAYPVEKEGKLFVSCR